MTSPQVNVEGPQSGDRVQVEARGQVVDTHPLLGVLVQLDDGPSQPMWLPPELVVLLDPRATS
jgi:hypothetical protein